MLKPYLLLACMVLLLADCNTILPVTPTIETLPTGSSTLTSTPVYIQKTTASAIPHPTNTLEPSLIVTPVQIHESEITEEALPTEEVYPTLLPEYWHIAIVMTNDNTLWLWEKGQKRLLYEAPAGTYIPSPIFSSDGRQIAFLVNGQLWLINTDGTCIRQLLSSDTMSEIGKKYEPTPFPIYSIWKYAWRADGGAIFFTTGAWGQAYPHSLDDLNLVDTQSGEIKKLLPAGQGGMPFPSPNGRKVLVLTADRVGVMNTDGSDLHWSMDFDPRVTHAEVVRYLKPIWVIDSLSFIIAVPPPDEYHQPADVPLKVWKVPANGDAPLLAAELLVCSPDLLISPDGKHILYYFNSTCPRLDPQPPYTQSLRLRSLDSGVEKDFEPAGVRQGCWTKDGRYALMPGEKTYFLDMLDGSMKEFEKIDAAQLFCLDDRSFFRLWHGVKQDTLALVSLGENIYVYDLGPISGENFDFVTSKP